MQQKKCPGSGILKRSRETFVPSRLYLRHLDTAWHIADGHWLNILERMASKDFSMLHIRVPYSPGGLQMSVRFTSFL